VSHQQPSCSIKELLTHKRLAIALRILTNVVAKMTMWHPGRDQTGIPGIVDPDAEESKDL